MNLKPSLQETLFTSTLPLVLNGAITVARQQLFPEGTLNFKDMVNPSSIQRSPAKSENESHQLFDGLQREVSDAYNSWPKFLIMMIVLNIITQMLYFRWITFRQKRLKDSELKLKESKAKTRPLLMLHIAKRIFYYSIFYCIYQNINACLKFYRTNLTQTQILDSSSWTQEYIFHATEKSEYTEGKNSFTRSSILEDIFPQDDAEQDFPLQNSRQLASITPAPGFVIGTLATPAGNLILSRDQKTAFVSLVNLGFIQIIDVSKHETPKIISTIKLKQVQIKALVLSKDEKTLFAADSFTLEIIDISNHKTPVLLGSKSTSYQLPITSISSIVLTGDETRVWVSGAGLVIWDVSNKQSPQIIFEKNLFKKRTGVSISSDGKTIYFANGTMIAFDVSNPKERKQIWERKTNLPAVGVLGPTPSNNIYVLCIGENATEILEIDISERTEPSVNNRINLQNSASNGYLLFVNSDESKLYLSSKIVSLPSVLYEVDLIHNKYKSKLSSHITQTTSLVFSPDEKIMFFVTNSALTIYRMFFNDRNTHIQSHKAQYISELDLALFKAYDYCFSTDEKFIFFLRKEEDDRSSILIFDVSDWNSPSLISKSILPCTIEKFQIFGEERKLAFECNGFLDFLDIQDKKNLYPGNPIKKQDDRSYLFTTDGEILFLTTLQNRNLESQVLFWNISDIDNPTLFGNLSIWETKDPTQAQASATSFKLLLSKDEKTLFAVGAALVIIDISNLTAPKIVSSSQISHIISFFHLALSSDQKALYILVNEFLASHKLLIYDISNQQDPQPIGSLTLPMGFYESIITTPNDDIIYLPEDPKGLLEIDVSNKVLPKLVGFSSLGEKNFGRVKVSRTFDKAYYLNSVDKLRIVSLLPEKTLYISPENFPLGVKTRIKPELFVLNSERKYVAMEESFKYLSLSLFEVNAGFFSSMELTYPYLPKCFTFDKDNAVFVVETNKNDEIGKYNIHAKISTKVTPEKFVTNKVFENKQEVLDLFMTLITMGFLDHEHFLTINFDPAMDFMLPGNYTQKLASIKEILTDHLITATTRIEIIPSLQVETHQKAVSIKTPIENGVSLVFALQASTNLTMIQFLPKNFSIQATFTEDYSALFLEGPLQEINKALREIVIDFLTIDENCTGKIQVSDFLNSPVTFEIHNLSEYFHTSKGPFLSQDLSVQSQIDRISISTGSYFSLELDPKTFVDKNGQPLNYKLTSKKKEEIPSWIKLNGLEISGTPPEKFSPLEIDLVLQVSNEYKIVSVPFKLNIRISLTHLLKVIALYGGYLITALGLYLYVNKVYNFIAKKLYQYPKSMIVYAGEEITEDVIVPIGLISEELKESKLIFSLLKETVAKRIGKAFNNGKLVEYFMDTERGRLDMIQLNQTIKEAVNTLTTKEKEQLPFYISAVNSRATVIDQIIFNNLVMLQLSLPSEKETKKIFKKVKSKWYEIIDSMQRKLDVSALSSHLGLDSDQLDPDNNFEDSQTKLKEISESRFLEEKLIVNHLQINAKINLKLLEDALLAEKFSNENIDIEPNQVNIIAKLKVKSLSRWRKLAGFLLNKFLWKRLKAQPLQPFNDKGKIGYGIRCKVEDNTLSFYGIPHRNIKDKTIAIQILNEKGKILRELIVIGSVQGPHIRRTFCKLENDVL